MTLTTDLPNDKKPPQCPPLMDNADNRSESVQMSHHHVEEPPFCSLPPPFHEFRSYNEIWICLTHLFVHLTRFNHLNASCDDESPLPPTVNTLDSDMSEYCHVSPVSSYRSLRIPRIIKPQTNHQNSTTYLDNKPTFRVYTKEKTDYSLTIRNGKVILAPTNSSDLHQHWIKDEKFGSSIKDEKGNPAFALVNKATGEALKFSIGVTYPVQLKKYNPNEVDMTVLWSEGNDLGDGYRSFRTVTNIHLNLDAYKGIKKYGGVQDGTEIVLWEWNDGDNQKWIIFPYCKSLITNFN
ncbi:hypothetical protein LXL04_014352 [Taraxacum kok-saghyz]